LWPGGWHEQGQRGNRVLRKREYVDGMCGPPRVGAGALINGESGLSVGCCRYQAKAATSLPRRREEGPDGLAPRIPQPPRLHGEGRVFFEEGHEAVQIMPFPGP